MEGYLDEQFNHKFRKHLARSLEIINIKPDSSQMDRMMIHASELMKWNQKFNLTAIDDPVGVAEKHFFDSIAASTFLGNEQRIADIGSGGGFPGIPIKIMNPSMNIVMVDASQKKVNFLKHVIRSLGLENIDAIHARVEHLQTQGNYASSFDAVISRAFTNLDRFVGLTSFLLHENGKIYAMKGKLLHSELTETLADRFEFKIDPYQLPFEKADRYLIRILQKLR